MVDLSLMQLALLVLAGLVAGILNAVAGGGTYFSFPMLVLVGLPPILANTTNKFGIWCASVSSVGGFRKELAGGKTRTMWTYVGITIAGSLVGSVLLLFTSSDFFKALIPWLMLVATLLFAFGRHLLAWITRTFPGSHRMGTAGRVASYIGVFAIGIYGGFFGAAMAIMLMAVFELSGMRNMHQINSWKALITLGINTISTATFVVAGSIYWPAGLAMMVGGLVGGYLGASQSRRLPQLWVRRAIIAYTFGITLWFFVDSYNLGALVPFEVNMILAATCMVTASLLAAGYMGVRLTRPLPQLWVRQFIVVYTFGTTCWFLLASYNLIEL